jgi:hypothetical protein
MDRSIEAAEWWESDGDSGVGEVYSPEVGGDWFMAYVCVRQISQRKVS